MPFERQHQLERIHRVQSEAVAEQRHVVADPVGRESFQVEALDDQTLELLPNGRFGHDASVYDL